MLERSERKLFLINPAFYFIIEGTFEERQKGEPFESCNLK